MDALHKTHQTHCRAAILAALVFAFGLLGAPAGPIISEFLADNESGLRDQDSEFEDWIELYNPDSEIINLGGYYLTDNELNLTKWQIPAPTNLAPGEFLVIFASGKDRAVAGQQLHTNFALDDSGEYLALVAPDGVTVISEFSPNFPVQFDDASYGYEQMPVTFEDVLVDVDEACTALVPTNAGLGTSWTQLSFDDSLWTAGTLGVGYERGEGYQNLINLDVELEAFNNNPSVLVRIPFTVTDLDQIIGLELDLQYDDGFTAYLNGVRVSGINGPTTPAWNSNATQDRTDEEALDFATFSLNSQINRLQEGENILAIQVLNSSASDDNLLLRPRLSAERLTALTLGELVYFSTPTPGGRNGAQEELPASEVIISTPSQVFTEPFRVTLSSTFEGETIRYTLDGTVPTSTSPEYRGSIAIANSVQLRARVFGAGNAAGPVTMESYLKVDARLATFSSNLPIILLDTWGKGDPDGNSLKDAFWAVIEPDPLTGRASITDPFQIATRCGLKRRGSSSFGWPKYSMTVEAQNEEGLDKGVKPIGMPRESDWVLSGRYQFDHALMRNDLIYELSRQTGEYATRTRFVEVFHNTRGGDLSYNATYFGVYSLMEKIKRDDNRVNVARIDRRDTREPDVTGGYIFKKDRLDPGDSGFSASRMGTMGWVEPKEREVMSAQRTWLQQWLAEVDAALYSPTWSNPSTGKHFTEYIDQFSWLRHHWCNTLAMNVDGFRLSGYYYKHRIDTNDGKLGAGPIWDFDRTMGSTDGRDDNPSQWDGTGDSSRTWDDNRYPWWGQALRNPDFRQAHTDLWQELRQPGNVFDIANIWAVIDDYAAQIGFEDPEGTNSSLNIGSSPAQRNWDKWRQGSSNYASAVSTLKSWLRTRTGWIDRQYTTPPRFSTAGEFVMPGVVTAGDEFAFLSGTIYYTTDGTDPRLPGGEVSSAATRVTGNTPITVNETTVLTARAFDTTPFSPLTAWSGPIQASFVVGPIADASNFAITEVHYAPLPAESAAELAASTEPADFEFIEMRNLNPTDTINLTGVHFEAGIDFTFTGSDLVSLAPGERVLIVRNRAAFEARYGISYSDRIAGEFAPSRLQNDGERLHLVDALGGTIADFTYNDKNPWPEDSGVTGYSLVLKALAFPNPNYSDASQWRSSTAIGGNPNRSDSTGLVGNPNDDDDGDGFDKILEHALGTSDADPADTAGAMTVEVQPLAVANLTDLYFTVTFQRSLSADDVDLFPELSYTLGGGDWTNSELVLLPFSDVNQGDGTSLVTYRSATPLDPAAHPEAFVRLRASMP